MKGRRSWATSVWCVMFASWAFAVTAASDTVSFRSTRGVVTLSDGAQQVVASKMRTLLSWCGYNFFPRDSQDAIERQDLWAQMRSAPHLLGVFPEGFESTADGGRRHRVKEVLYGLQGFPSVLARSGDAIVTYAKCNGGLPYDVKCDPNIRPI